MKKTLCFVLTISMLFTIALTGCGSQTEKTNAEQTEQVEQNELDYPKMAITINTSKAGSNVDTIARIFAKAASEHVGTNVIVNSTSGQVDAARQTLTADPDGYTLCSINNTVVINDVMGSTDFHSIDDFSVLGSFCLNSSAWIGITKELAEKCNIATFEDLVKYTDEHPNELSICNQSANTTYVTVTGLIDAGLKVTPVDVGSAETRITNVLGGVVDIYIGAYSYLEQYVENGDMICLANAGENRSQFTPDIPCTYELGFEAGCPVRYYLCGPAGMSDELVQYWSAMIEEICKDETFVQDLASSSIEVSYMDSTTVNEYLSTSRDEMISIGMGTGYQK